MNCLFCLLFIMIIIIQANAGLFFVSNRELHISPLKQFTNVELDKLIEELDEPIIQIFKSSSKVNPGLKSILNRYYSAYSPNGKIKINNVVELRGDESDKQVVVNKLHAIPDERLPFLLVFMVERDDFPTSIKHFGKQAKELPQYYVAKSQLETFALFYSSASLRLLFRGLRGYNISLPLPLANHTQYDAREGKHYLNLSIFVNYKDTPRFINLTLEFLAFANRQWALPNIRIFGVMNDSGSGIDLESKRKIVFPFDFSYHCPGRSSFVNKSAGVVLRVYDIQVQVNSTEKEFADSWDCIQIFTPAIWTGLSVAALCTFVFAISTVAMVNIQSIHLVTHIPHNIS